MHLKAIYKIKEEIQCATVEFVTDDSNSPVSVVFNHHDVVNIYSGECSILISDFKVEYRELLNNSLQATVEARKASIEVILENCLECITKLDNGLYSHLRASQVPKSDPQWGKYVELASPFVEVQLTMLRSVQNILKHFTKENETKGTIGFVSDAKRQQLFDRLVSLNKYNPSTQKWTDKSSGWKDYVASLLKSLHVEGYFTSQLSKEEIVIMAQELFDVKISESTAAHASTNSPQLNEIFQ